MTDKREIKFRAFADGEMIYRSDPSEIFGNYNSNIMQYTGLKDKNGVEVYEGDICLYQHFPDDVVVIIFDEDLLTFKSTVVYDGVYCDDSFFIKSDSRRYEIIGNIYENEELLNKSI